MESSHGPRRVIPESLGIHEICGGNGSSDQADGPGQGFDIGRFQRFSDHLFNLSEVGGDFTEIHGEIAFGQLDTVDFRKVFIHLMAQLQQQFGRFINRLLALGMNRRVNRRPGAECNFELSRRLFDFPKIG